MLNIRINAVNRRQGINKPAADKSSLECVFNPLFLTDAVAVSTH
ncbi:Uncharacterized protein YP598_0719 [Yersinia pseudotuberculosis]|nr:Uncharacterized protein YP598_0719 [Yersinia pseudotuberculosis]